MRPATFARAALRPVLPALAASLVVLVGAARLTEPDSLLELLPLGLGWCVVSGIVLWRFGFDRDERAVLSRQLRPGPPLCPIRCRQSGPS